MASALYSLGKEHLLKGDYTIETGETDLKIMMFTSATTFNDSNEFYSQQASGRLTMSLTALSSITTNSPTPCVVDAADTTCSTVSGGASDNLILIMDSGTEGSSYLVAWIEYTEVTPNGGNITFVWDSGANRIFKL